jgi:copper transport protein
MNTYVDSANSIRSRPARQLAFGVALIAAVHAHLVSSSPADGDALEESPPEIRLAFSEPVEAGLSRVTMVFAAGETVVPVRADSTDVRVLIGTLPPLAVAEYRVDWRTVSADGHPVEGSFRFTVLGSAAVDSAVAGQPAPAPAPADGHVDDHGHSGPNAPAGISAVLRGLALFSLLVLAGWLVQMVALGDGAPRAWRTAVALAAAASALLGAHFAAWLWHVTPAGTSPDLVAALRTGPGRVEAIRIALAVLALWAVGLARRAWPALALALAAVLVSGATGHAAGIDPRWSIPLKSLHLIALAVWMGGVAWLAVAALGDDAFRASAARVSRTALGAVAVVGLTGLAQGALFLPGLDAVFGSAYGRLLLAKAAGLAGLVAFGAWNRSRLLPRLAAGDAPAALRGSTRRELALMLAVSLVAGVLAYVPPPPA